MCLAGSGGTFCCWWCDVSGNGPLGQTRLLGPGPVATHSLLGHQIEVWWSPLSRFVPAIAAESLEEHDRGAHAELSENKTSLADSCPVEEDEDELALVGVLEPRMRAHYSETSGAVLLRQGRWRWPRSYQHAPKDLHEEELVGCFVEIEWPADPTTGKQETYVAKVEEYRPAASAISRESPMKSPERKGNSKNGKKDKASPKPTAAERKLHEPVSGPDGARDVPRGAAIHVLRYNDRSVYGHHLPDYHYTVLDCSLPPHINKVPPTFGRGKCKSLQEIPLFEAPSSHLDQKGEQASAKEAKPYPCKRCGFVFSSKAALATHTKKRECIPKPPPPAGEIVGHKIKVYWQHAHGKYRGEWYVASVLAYNEV